VLKSVDGIAFKDGEGNIIVTNSRKPIENLEKNTIPGNVYVYEPLGDEAIVNVDTGGNTMKVITSTIVKLEIKQKVYLKQIIGKIYISSIDRQVYMF
jgi:ABC-type sugar transport system ATPase subunit